MRHVTLTVFLFFVACGMDTDAMAYFKPGDKVRLMGQEKGCYAIVLELIGVSKVKVKIMCHEYIAISPPILNIGTGSIMHKIQ